MLTRRANEPDQIKPYYSKTETRHRRIYFERREYPDLPGRRAPKGRDVPQVRVQTGEADQDRFRDVCPGR